MAAISGFPEFLPEGRFIETRALDILRQVFELHGFAGIQTRSLEPLAELSRKGEITKEVYVVRRLHAESGEEDAWGLHYDLTVPFARYVLDHAGHLNFPFRRYQIQPAWRGERPQEGRFREFWQADIDIVGQSTLSFHHDSEVVLVMLEACERLHHELGIPPVLMRINNRKLIQGFYAEIGIADPLAAIQIVDKLPKIGEKAVGEILSQQGIGAKEIDLILRFAAVSSTVGSVKDQVQAFGLTNEILQEGLEEVQNLFDAVHAWFPANVVIDCKIARGLDYYTGSVFELELQGKESLGTVCAGGRYDSLATDGKTTYPGVGISFGVSRVFVPLISKGDLRGSRSVPSAVLVAVDSEDQRPHANEVAHALRSRGIPCEVSPNSQKYGKQIRFADKRGIPYVWFGSISGQIKDIRTGDQSDADALSWTPPNEDMIPYVIRT
ncbi:MAG: histidine--tRNA ligase [Propionibacteriaceae bacterium]|jgi:histidyl-tRNA synthetase|nr:histidine--tRNA ligase [Propionibacteriaceae bacterium]